MEPSGELRSILIADNSRTARILMEERIRQVLGKVFIIQTGDGLRAYESARVSPPDLLVTSVRLSRMNGITLVKKIIASKTYPFPLRVLLVTPFNREACRRYLGQLVRLEFADKPFDPEELSEVLGRLV